MIFHTMFVTSVNNATANFYVSLAQLEFSFSTIKLGLIILLKNILMVGLSTNTKNLSRYYMFYQYGQMTNNYLHGLNLFPNN